MFGKRTNTKEAPPQTYRDLFAFLEGSADGREKKRVLRVFFTTATSPDGLWVFDQPAGSIVPIVLTRYASAYLDSTDLDWMLYANLQTLHDSTPCRTDRDFRAYKAAVAYLPLIVTGFNAGSGLQPEYDRIEAAIAFFRVCERIPARDAYALAYRFALHRSPRNTCLTDSELETFRDRLLRDLNNRNFTCALEIQQELRSVGRRMRSERAA